MLEKRQTNKRIKLLVAEFESQAKDIRGQLCEQLKLLEQRTDTQSALICELQDFYRRRADVDLEYSRQLDKLAKHVLAKHKTEKSKRENWQQHGMYSLWTDLIEDTKQEAKTRSVLSDLYSNHVAPKLAHHSEDLQRIARKCREIGSAEHQDVCRVLNELHTAMKTYQLCSAEAVIAESKFKSVEAQKTKFEEACPQKIGSSRKHKFLEKEFEKKHSKYVEYRGKALRARNEYLLCIDAANSALHHYFAEDLSDLIDGMDLGLQQWLASLLATVISARKSVMDNEMDSLDQLRAFAGQLDSRVDKQKFIEAHHTTFMLPRRFEFRPHQNDEIRCVSAQKVVQDELVQRYVQMEKRLQDLEMENEEVWKTLETAEKRVLELQKQPVAVISDLFTPTTSTGAPGSNNVMNMSSHTSIMGDTRSVLSQSNSLNNETGKKQISLCKEPDIQLQKRKQDLAETEDFYLDKFQLYLLSGNLMKRLQARRDAIRKALNIPDGRGGHDPNRAPYLEHRGSEGGAHQNGHMLHSDRSSTSEQRVQNGARKQPPERLQLNRETMQMDDPLPTPGSVGSNGSDDVLIVSTEGVFLDGAPPCVPPKPSKKKRIGHSDRPMQDRRPKLFGGTVDEYIEATGEDIPLVVHSCVKLLAEHGLHHQGVFRVSGSQAEINRFKEAFERGEDPLEDLSDGNYVNSVAGVLKLYFRELREPLFPIYMFDQFTDLSKIANKEDFLIATRELIENLSRPVYVLLRYLFAFLNHLSEYADENMMDPYNLAICFGPTLLPIPEGKDQVFFHNYVNELVKNLIVRHEEVFENDTGPFYEKYLVACDVLDEQNDEQDGNVVETDLSEDTVTQRSTVEHMTESLVHIDDTDSNLSLDSDRNMQYPKVTTDPICVDMNGPPLRSGSVPLTGHVHRDPPSPAPLAKFPVPPEPDAGPDPAELVWTKRQTDSRHGQKENFGTGRFAGQITNPGPILSPRENLEIAGVPETGLAVEWVESRRRRSNRPTRNSEEKRPHSKPRHASPRKEHRSHSRGKARQAYEEHANKVQNAYSKPPANDKDARMRVSVAETNVAERAMSASTHTDLEQAAGTKNMPAKRLSLQNDSPPLRNTLKEFQSPVHSQSYVDNRCTDNRCDSANSNDSSISPTYLRDIQSELKAVLSSLEQFTVSQKADSKPDLVLNLPLKGTSLDSNSPNLPTSAEQFAETTGTIVKKTDSPRTSHEREQRKETPPPRPPVARKPATPLSENRPITLAQNLEMKIEKL